MARGTRTPRLLGMFGVLMLAACAWIGVAAPAENIPYLSIEGVINPVTARYLTENLEKAAAQRAPFMVLRLDTPGGTLAAMRRMAQAILGASVPVIIYVAPPGAHAASAGMFITAAAHVAAMAPATMIGVSGHAVGKTTAAVQALIGAAPAFERDSFLVPLRNGELFGWCLTQGFRVAVPETLMSQGFYQEPVGAFLPSVLY